MQEKPQTFQIENELGEIKEAKVLTVVELENKTYCVYTIDNGNDTVDVFASYVIQDENGLDTLVDIENPKDKELIENYIKRLAIK